jgi:hypothetical protein
MRGTDRQDEMARRLRQAEVEGRALSIRMLSRYRADDNPKPARQYSDRVRASIVNAVRREMLAGYGMTTVKDWWMVEDFVPSMKARDGQASRDVAVAELRRLADTIEVGPSRS